MQAVLVREMGPGEEESVSLTIGLLLKLQFDGRTLLLTQV